MTIPTKPFTFSNGTAADAIEVNADFDSLYSTLAGSIDSTNITSASIKDSDIDWGTGANQVSAVDVPIADAGSFYTGTTVEAALQEAGAALVPVGSIIPFYDLGAVCTFTAANWEYCDGSVVTSATSPIVGQTKPDLSNRYLVGFGTEGGTDIDTAAWATAAVGNANHQIDLAHTHTGPSHTHTVTATGTSDAEGTGATGSGGTGATGGSGTLTSNNESSHTHGGSVSGTTINGDSHTHSVSGIYAEIGADSTPGSICFISSGTSVTMDRRVYWDATYSYTTGNSDSTLCANIDGTLGSESTHEHEFSDSFTTSSNSGHSHTIATHTHTGPSHTHTGPSHTHTFTSGSATSSASGTGATGSAGSATTDIQPRSVRVRFIMRVL
jgi:hypothetical protein